MALLTDNYHIKKLNKYGINIKTKYIVGNTILERILITQIMMILYQA